MSKNNHFMKIEIPEKKPTLEIYHREINKDGGKKTRTTF